MKKEYIVTCFCGNEVVVPQYTSTDEPVTVVCKKCGQKIHSKALRPTTCNAEGRLQLLRIDHAEDFRDVLPPVEKSDGKNIIPVYCGYTFHTEYGTGRWDECAYWIQAVSLDGSRPDIDGMTFLYISNKIENPDN